MNKDKYIQINKEEFERLKMIEVRYYHLLRLVEQLKKDNGKQ